MDYLSKANSMYLWLAVSPVVLIVALQAIIFVRKALESAKYADLSHDEAMKAFRVGATSAIGPALGVFVVMLGLMAAIGGPLAWQRLAIIGAAPTELAAANMAAQAQGVSLGGEGYKLLNFANATWVMALNGSAWLLTTALFSDKLEKITHKVSGGDAKKIGILGTGAMLGAMGFLVSNEINKGLKPGAGGIIVAAVAAFVSMLVLERIAKKIPKLVEFNLGIAMVIGMIAAVAYNHM
ncbi:DUF5058 family protein [Clostridiaceae bacterium HFYG-1003]|nr:DUF5058 family protein [Clostridiaceae bacterium HFYG-1003]